MAKAIKRNPPYRTAALIGYGEIKMTAEGLMIEGFANKAVVDRGNDIISPDAWDLKNYEKNPVILYNHGFDPQLGSTPVGKAVAVKPTENGLWVKAKMSAIDDPLINRIRGLVQEKILRAFSVGFNSIESQRDSKTGTNTISKAELFEVSIVGVPMNQDSLFELTSKMLKTMDDQTIVKTVLERKGAWVAAAIHNAMYEAQRDRGLKRPDILDALAKESGIDLEALTDILAGNVTPVPQAVMAAASEILGIDLEGLVKLDQGDVEVENAETSEEGKDDTEEEDGAEVEAGSEEEEDQDSGEGGDSEKEGVGEESSGSDKKPAPKGDDGDEEYPGAKDFAGCVGDKIAKLIAEGKDQDQAVAQAISMCSEGKCQKPTKEDYGKWFKLADALVAKQADQDVKQPPTTEISTDRTEEAQDNTGNPSLEAQKQTNVLLGQVVAELQALQKLLVGMAIPAESKEEIPAVTEPEKPGDQTIEATIEDRAKKYGIEIREDAGKSFAEGEPADLEKYGDPVNLKYPLDTADKADEARAKFKDEIGKYKEDGSKTVVHSRIVGAQIALGLEPSFDEKDDVDSLLSQAIKDKLLESNTKTLDSVRRRIETMKRALIFYEEGGSADADRS